MKYFSMKTFVLYCIIFFKKNHSYYYSFCYIFLEVLIFTFKYKTQIVMLFCQIYKLLILSNYKATSINLVCFICTL